MFNYFPDVQTEYFHEPDKKPIHFHQDLTQGNITAKYEYPHHGQLPNAQNIPLQIPRSVSEHHYDVPHLTSK